MIRCSQCFVVQAKSEVFSWKDKCDIKVKELEEQKSKHAAEIERLVGLLHSAQRMSHDLKIQNESLRSKLEVSSIQLKNLQKESRRVDFGMTVSLIKNKLFCFV